MKQGNRTTSPQAPSAEDLAYLPGVSATTRLVLIALRAEPHASNIELGRRVHVPRSTVQRALDNAEAAGVIRRGPSVNAERGVIEWTTVSPPAAPCGTPLPHHAAPLPHHAAPPAAPCGTPAPLPGMESSYLEVGQGQGQGPPPSPPSISALADQPASPSPRVADREALDEAFAKVKRLRREKHLATGAVYDRDLKRILGSLALDADCSLDEVAEAAGAAWALTEPSIVVELNRRRQPVTGGRRHVARDDPAARAEAEDAAAGWSTEAFLAQLDGGGLRAKVRP